MRYGELGQNDAVAVQEPRVVATPVAAKEIPYDYVATFRLTGEFGRRHQDVIAVSTEGTFVAVAIGYSFLPPRYPITAVSRAAVPPGLTVNNVALGPRPTDLLDAVSTPAGQQPPVTLVQSLAQNLVTAIGVHFRYSLVDSGTGRELQNQPIHNIAGLGSALGERPFRPFARPAFFLPRSTIRFEVEEVSEGPVYAGGTLYIVLQGYKRLGE